MMTTFDASDWNAFSGCVSFSDGSDPLIGELVIQGIPILFIADGNGMIADISHDDPNPVWLHNPAVKTPKLARAVFRLIRAEARFTALRGIGFSERSA